MEHLSENARQFIDKSIEERIYKIQSEKWIGYTRANNILNKLEDLISYPPSFRMPNALIVGDTNNGKTLLVNKFFGMHKPFIFPLEERLLAKVIYMQAPYIPDEKKFYNALLDSLNTPYKLNDKVERKQNIAFTILKKLETRILIIDEIHNILAGSLSKQRVFLYMLKYLTNELKISIVAVGTNDAFHAINTDYQLANRFERLILPKWQYNEDYLRLLASFETTLPLKYPSNLIEDKIALKILGLSEGTIGEISKILMLSAIQAIKTRKEKIDLEILSSIDYVSPSERSILKERII